MFIFNFLESKKRERKNSENDSRYRGEERLSKLYFFRFFIREKDFGSI